MLAVVSGGNGYFETRMPRRKRGSAMYRPDVNVFTCRVKSQGIAGMVRDTLAQYCQADGQALCPEPTFVTFYSLRSLGDLAQREYIPVGVYTLPAQWAAMVRAGLAEMMLTLAPQCKLHTHETGVSLPELALECCYAVKQTLSSKATRSYTILPDGPRATPVCMRFCHNSKRGGAMRSSERGVFMRHMHQQLPAVNAAHATLMRGPFYAEAQYTRDARAIGAERIRIRHLAKRECQLSVQEIAGAMVRLWRGAGCDSEGIERQIGKL